MTTFIKYIGDSYQSEWERNVLLYEASLRANWFSSPRPLSIDSKKKSIIFEHLPQGQTFAEYLVENQIFKTQINQTDVHELFHKIGLALAEIHKFMPPATPEILNINDILFGSKGLTGPNHIQKEMIKNNLASAPLAAIHGDFGLGNIWLGENGQLTIFDPVPSDWIFNPSAGKASIYYDLGHLIMSIWILYPISFIKIWDLKNANYLKITDSLIRTFQKGYEEQSGIKLNRETLFATAFCLLNSCLTGGDYFILSEKDITWAEFQKEKFRINLRLKLMKTRIFQMEDNRGSHQEV